MRQARTDRTHRVRGLYAVTPDLADTDTLIGKVRAAIEGGARAVQYRDKSPARAAQRARALRLADLCKRHDVLFIVNDDATLARDVDADGVHVGEDDGDLADVREIVGDDRVIGLSCYDDFGRARDGVRSGADYVAFGSFFASSVKPAARRAPLDLLARARALAVPVVAIGGIDATNAGSLRDAGANAVAVISAVFAHEAHDDIVRHARAIAELFTPSSTGNDA